MSAARRGLEPADELLLAALDRRLGAIDDELPRLRPWRADRVAAGQLHVVRGRLRPAGARAGARSRPLVRVDLAAGGMAAVLAVAVLALNRGADVGRPGGVADASPPGPAFSFGPTGPARSSPAPTPASTHLSLAPEPKPAPLGPGPGPVSDAADAAAVAAVLERLQWRCGVLIQVALDPLGSAQIDKLAVIAGEQNGYIRGALGPGWVGTDPQLAARAFKGRPLMIDATGSVWILRADGSTAVALRLEAERARSGATAWRPADALWSAACPPPGTDPKALLAGHPPSDWPNGRIVDIRVVRSAPPTGLTRRPQ